MTSTIALTIVATSILCLWIGFYLGDEARHEADDIVEERGFDRHVQSAMWVARRSL